MKLQQQLTGPEKAVLMLLSMEETVAEPILRELTPEQVRTLRTVAAEMRAVPASAISGVYSEFIEKSSEAVAMPSTMREMVRKMTTRALGEVEETGPAEEKPLTSLQRIEQADVRILAGLLRTEDPQLVAALMSQLPPEKAAPVVERLPPESRSQVVTRLGSLTEVPEELVLEIADAIAAELPEPGAGGCVSVDGISRSAAVVRSLRKETSEVLLGEIEQENETLASEIRQAMYSFQDLAVMDPRGMRELLKAVPGDRLTLALKTAGPELAQLIYSGMSKRAAERVREDLQLMGAVKLSDVEQAQREIVEIALRLESEGTLSLGGGGDDLV
jgi:flagellar motor switch protein FliG